MNDHDALAIERAAKYQNVYLGENSWSVAVMVSSQLIPELLKGVEVKHVQLVPCGDELQLQFTARGWSDE